MFYKARVYSTALGRFLQTDPIGTKDDLNLYVYVGNDPVNKTDPTGMYGGSEWIDGERAQACAGDPNGCLAAFNYVGTTFGPVILDFTPVIGDAKGFYDAYWDGSPEAWSVAAISLVPGLDIAKYANKAADGIRGADGSFKDGAFSVIDWTGYPSALPRPTGPSRLLPDSEYNDARRLANNMNRAIHRADPSADGFDVHELMPVKFGGSPFDPNNKTFLSPADHADANWFWSDLKGTIEGYGQ